MCALMKENQWQRQVLAHQILKILFFIKIYTAENPVLWPPHTKSWLIGKDFNTGRDWGQEKQGMTENEMAGWHYWLDGRESQWTPVVGDGQGGPACCDSGVTKSQTWLSDWTELNWYCVLVIQQGNMHSSTQFKWLSISMTLTQLFSTTKITLKKYS